MQFSKLYSHLTVVDENAQLPEIYIGEEEVSFSLAQFDKEYEDMDYDINWTNKNKILTLIHSETSEILSIRDFGRYNINGASFLFVTDYIPIYI